MALALALIVGLLVLVPLIPTSSSKELERDVGVDMAELLVLPPALPEPAPTVTMGAVVSQAGGALALDGNALLA